MKKLKVFLVAIIVITTNIESAWAQLVGGTIADNQTICYNTGAAAFTSSEPASGGTPTYTYTWQWSTTSSTAGVGDWTDITDSNTEIYNYSSVLLTTTTYFTRKVVDAAATPGVAYSNVITITVNPVSVGGSISGFATVCSGSNSTTLTLSGHTGEVLRWESTVDNWVSAPTEIANTTTTLDAINLTATTKYRAVVKSGACSETNSSDATITVSPVSAGGSISGSATVCSGSNSTTLTLSGHTGEVVRWESTVDNWVSAPTVIANTTTTLDAINLTATTKYRAVVKSGACSETNSSDVTITVNPETIGGSVTGGSVIISGETSGLLTLSGHIGVVIKWQYSTNGSDWFDISNTLTTYTSGVLTQTTQFRAVVQSGVCSEANSSPTTVTIDGTIPNAALSYSDSDVLFHPGQSVTITATFSEAMADSPKPRLVFSAPSTLGWVEMTKNTSTVYFYDYTVENVNGTISLSLSTGTDIAGNVVDTSPTSGETFTVDNIPPSAPIVSGLSSTNDDTPTWTWTAGGGGNGTFRYKLDDSNLLVGATETVSFSFTPSSSITEESHTLYVQERDAAGNWSSNGSFTIIVDKTTQAPTLNLPLSNSGDNHNLDIEFYLPENALPGSVKMVFTRSGGEPDDCAPITLVFKNVAPGNFELAGTHSTIIDGENLDGNVNVASVTLQSGSCTDWLINGTYYDVTIEYRDALGNAKATSTICEDFLYSNIPPTATVTPVSPDPRNTSVSSVVVNFSNWVWKSTVDNSDFKLQRTYNSSTVDIDLSGIVITASNKYFDKQAYKTYTISGLSTLTSSEGTYVFSLLVKGDIYDVTWNYLIVGASDTWENDQTLPTADIVDISPDPRNNAVGVVTINFSENVTGVDISDFTLTRGGAPVSLTGIVVSGSGSSYTLNLSTVTGISGTYVLTVNSGAGIKDIAGNNLAANASDTWDVDATPPNLSSISIQSNNPYNTAFAKVGDIVTLSFTADENVQNVVVLINGVAATSISGGPISWTASREMKNTDSEGVVTFSIDYKDMVMNSGATKTEITTGLDVEFYKSAPTLNSVIIVSDNTYNNRAKVGNTITLNFSSATKLSNVIVSLANHSVVATTSNDKDWTATWTMIGGDSEGFVPFTINYTDKPGNPGAAVSTTSNSSKVKFDKTKPELNAVTIASNNAYPQWVGVGGIVTVSITSSENIILTGASIKGTAANILGSGKNWTASYTLLNTDTDGVVNFEITSYADSAGNIGDAVTSTTNSSTVTFDKTAPNLTDVSIVSDNADATRAKTGDLVKILFTADDSIVNVTAKVNAKNAVVTPMGGNAWEAEYPISGTIADGILSYVLTFKDLAGNNATATASTDGSKVKVDNTFPSYSSVSIYSNNANTALAKANDIITIDFVTSENIKTPAVTINNIAATSITGSLKNWTATRTVLTGEPQGIIPISVDIQDSTGNVPATRFSTTDGSNVTFDDSNPIISSITVPAGTFKVGDVIPVTIITDGNSYTGTTVEVNGKPQTLINNGNNSYTVNYSIAENDIERNALAALPVNIVLTDAAGLSTSRSNANVSSGTITIDSKTPRIDTFTSNAEAVGIARIGSEIIFTLKTLIAETGLTITPTLYNGKTLNWTTVDAGATYTSKYTVAEGDPEHIVPLQLGDISLADIAGNKDAKLLVDYNPIQKQIFTTKPTVQITGSKTKCYNGLNEPVTFQFTGTQPYDLWYTHDGVKYVELGITSSTFTTQIQGGTVSLDSLVDATTNRIYTAPSNVTITVNPLPVVTFDITGSPYSPDSPKDELNKYVLPADKRNGLYSGEGVGFLSGKYYFYPTIIPTESKDKNLEIIYIYTDALGCVGKDTSYAFVSSTPVNIPDLKAGYCNYAEPFTVTGVLPSGHTGVFELYNSDNTPLTVGWSQIDSETLSISPQLLSVGTYKVTYRALRLPSMEETSFINKTFTIEAKKTGIAISGLATEYCFNDLANDIEFTVSGVTLESGDKGHFTGSTVFNTTTNSHTAKFKYSTALANADYSISYIYESVNGCLSDPVNHNIHINPLPDLIFTLNDNYNFNQATIPLIGNQTSTSYLFSGEGVSRDTLFTSAARVGSPIIITYSYTDGKGCSSQTQQSTTIYKATETIGLSSVYCYEDKYIDIACSPNISDTITGTFISKRNAIESTGKNLARYFLNKVGNGKDTVYYNYKIKGTDYSVFKEVLVDSIGKVQIISNLEDYDYCKSETKVQLSGIQTHPYGGQGNFTYSGTGSAMLNRGSNAEIYPTEENPGSYNVTYTYTSNSGCAATDVKSINIYPVPVASFQIPASCPGIVDPIEFINTSLPNDETMEWLWSVEGQEFTVKDLTYKFQAIGSKKIILSVKSSNGCVAIKDTSINVGISAIADFDWDHDCNTGSPIVFTNKSTNGTVADFKWKLNENTIIGTTGTFPYNLSSIGTYNVELIIKTIDGCTDSITKQLMIQPYIKINDLSDSYYFETFDNTNPYNNWEAKGLTFSDTSRWHLGIPNGEIINKAYSGDNSWFTQLTDKQNVENSQVISPCFDLRGLKNPMIKLNIWSSSEYKRDGAVLQYSTDQGKSWLNLGAKSEGINWFDSENIQSQPGGSNQYDGWNEKPMNNWKTARHSLNNLIDNSNVRFRVAYAADGKGVSKVDGFAFDDVWIGNRNQNILFEYFTNTNIADAESHYQAVRDVELNLVEDIIPIHYHTSYPTGDPLYEFYKNGPSSRVYFYGVSQVPYARTNGNLAFTFPGGLNPTTYFKTLTDSIDVKSLNDPKVKLNIGASIVGNSCNIGISLNNNIDLTGKSIGLQCAVVKKSINVNGKVYHNVLRNFIPSPGGTIINTKLGQGDSQTINLTWTPINTDELVNATIIAYVQDLYSNEIYQAETFDLSVLTSVNPVDISELITVFPNPVNDILFITSEHSISEVVLYDISGRIINNISQPSNQITIPLAELKSGVYIIKGKTSKGYFVKKIVKM